MYKSAFRTITGGGIAGLQVGHKFTFPRKYKYFGVWLYQFVFPQVGCSVSTAPHSWTEESQHDLKTLQQKDGESRQHGNSSANELSW
jgi:hypothetical protein